MKSYISLVMFFVMSSGMSFLNQIVLAYFFGASLEFDVLNASLSLPSAIMGIGSGAVSLIIMPILSDYKMKNGDCTFLFFTILKKYYKIIFVLSLFVITAQYFFFYHQISSQEKSLFLSINLILLVFIFLNFINSLFMVYFNLKKQYIMASISSMMPSLTSIILLVLFAQNIGVTIVPISLLMSSLILLSIFYYNYMKNFTVKLNKDKDFKIKISYNSVLAGIISIMPFTIPMFINSYYLLNLTEGALSYISYANKLIIMITSLLIQPLNIILFPEILKKIHLKQFKYIYKLIYKLYTGVFIGLIIVYIIVNCCFLDAMHIFFEHGKFTSIDSMNIFIILKLFIIGAFGMIIMNIQNKILTSLHMYNTQIINSILFLVIYLIVVQYFINTDGFLAVGYAYSLSWLLITFSTISMVFLNLRKGNE